MTAYDDSIDYITQYFAINGNSGNKTKIQAAPSHAWYRKLKLYIVYTVTNRKFKFFEI